MKSLFGKSIVYLLLLYGPLILAAVMYGFEGDGKFKNYLLYQFPLKNWSLQKNAQLQMNVLGQATQGSIHFGKDSWLFYITHTDGSSYNDLLGIGTSGLSQQWEEYLKVTVNRPFGFNARYLLLFPPNKETVYPEKTNYFFLPFVDRSRGNYEQVRNMVQSKFSDVFVDIEPTLIEGKEKYPTYSAADTHWSQWGAYRAHSILMAKIAHTLNTNIQPIPLKSVSLGSSVRDDIYRMIPEDSFLRTRVNHFVPEVDIQLETMYSVDLLKEIEDYRVYGCSEKSLTVWFIGDSFGDQLQIFLSPYFKKTVFMRYASLDFASHVQMSLQLTGPPDLIIEERVERYLPKVYPYKDMSSM